MGIEDLLGQLADRKAEGHQAAMRSLIDAGAEAVGPLIAALLDEESPIDWSDAGFVLRKIGRPAFAPLAEAIASAPTAETRRRCGWTFVGFGADLVHDYATALSHPSSHVRKNAALGIQYLDSNGLSAVPALLPLLADSDGEVRQRAAWAFAGIGEDAVPVLQQVRVSGPGRLRAGALRALAEVAGERGLLPQDRRAIERLIRIKLLTERAEPLDDCGVCGPWLAVRSGDQAGLLDALDLSDPQPATLRLGFAAFYCDRHNDAPDTVREARVFVTPELDGWTLVLGCWYARWGDESSYGQANRELSARFGNTQAYWYDAQTSESAWSVCLDGEVVRWFDPEDASAGVGEPLPIEQGRRLPGERPGIPEAELAPWDHRAPDASRQLRQIYERNGVPEPCDALTVAGAMSLSPRDLGPRTTIRGHGLLALTVHGRQHGTPPGALPI